METTHPEEIWMPDITYIGNRNSHMSLNSLDTQSSLNILKLANRNRLYIEAPLIHHSNRGRPSFLIFAHIFFILKAMAKKEKSIKTLSFPKWRNVCSPYCIYLSEHSFRFYASLSSVFQSFLETEQLFCFLLVFSEPVIQFYRPISFCFKTSVS